MGDKRRSDYINLGAQYGAPRPNTGGLPRPDPTRGPVFVSHELQLLRDLEIINARTVAELGPLPPGGLPVVPKRRVDAKGRLLPEAADNSTTEDEAMKLSQTAAVAVLGVASTLTACGADPALQTTVGDAAQKESRSIRSDTSIESKLKEEMAYEDFRKVLLADGWSPVVSPECVQMVVGDNYREECSKEPASGLCRICNEFPEVGACSADGYCYLSFSKGDREIYVKTYGDILETGNEDSGADPVVIGWNLSGAGARNDD